MLRILAVNSQRHVIQLLQMSLKTTPISLFFFSLNIITQNIQNMNAEWRHGLKMCFRNTYTRLADIWSSRFPNNRCHELQHTSIWGYSTISYDLIPNEHFDIRRSGKCRNSSSTSLTSYLLRYWNCHALQTSMSKVVLPEGHCRFYYKKST
jgi:hypothetical protein